MAESGVKKEYLLEGLDCANCAAKIERNVSGLTGVTNCSVNFATKTLKLETEPDKTGQIIASTESIIKKLEPDVKMKDKSKPVLSRQTFYLEGLDCANCAMKIEKQAGLLTGVSTSHVDFVSKRLSLGTEKSDDLTSKISEIVRKLEPDVVVIPEQDYNSAKEDDNHNHGSSGIKMLWMRIAASAVLTSIAVFADLPFFAELSLFILAYIFVGGDVLLKAGRNIFRGQVFDENFLMAIATLGAFAIGEYPEAVAVMLFYQVGELFQSLAVNKSRRSISALMNIRPEYANLTTKDGTIKVSPEEVHIGDLILVKPGEKFPLDGIVTYGNAAVDTSALTGESIPRDVEEGSEVLSGFINKDGVVTVKVQKEFSESAVSKILELVENASSKKAPTENFITKFARYYTPVVVITALILAVIPPLLISDALFSDWIYRALVFLVISCPCALVVSIPLGFFGGIGGASKKGILIKGSNYLEALNDVKYVVFDKTGTLTKGVFEVTEIAAAAGFSNEELLKYAAFAEVHSSHPIALSIKKAYGKSVDEKVLQDYLEVAGQGIKVTAEGREILAGNRKLMIEEKVDFTEPKEGTVVHVAVDRKYAGYILISDQEKDDAKTAIQQLKALGIKKTIMLTGDAKGVGDAVGKNLGIDEVYAELLPHQKVEEIEKLFKRKSPKEKLIFVGDGINDTPVLARADIGIAMGGLGSDAAIEAADIVIMTDEPSKIADALKLAKRTKGIVWQNIIFALGVKAIFLLLGAFGIATMWEAVFSDVGVTVLAVLNSMRVLKVKD